MARQKAIAHNVSNLDTPGFKRFLVDFEKQIQHSGEQQLAMAVTGANTSTNLHQTLSKCSGFFPGTACGRK
jgi:flagellar basal-body rod protein FlgB